MVSKQTTELTQDKYTSEFLLLYILKVLSRSIVLQDMINKTGVAFAFPVQLI